MPVISPINKDYNSIDFMSLGCWQVNRYTFRFPLIAALLALSGQVLAIGLGELRSSSALGDRPRLEADILGTGKNLLDPACFRLVKPSGDDNLPWLKRGTFTVRKGNPAVLEILSDMPLNDPALAVAVYVACGQDMVREYVLLASPPTGRVLMTMEPVVKPRPVISTPSVEPREQVRPARAPATLATSVSIPEVGKVAVPNGSDKAAAEKIKSMEAAVNELQQRAGDLTQKIEETSATPAAAQPVVTPAPPVVVQEAPAKAQPAVANSAGSGWSLYAALIGALLVVAALLGWRRYRERKQQGEADGRDFEVDPPRSGERAERGGVDLQVDPVAMATPMKLDATQPAATVGASSLQPSVHDSMMSISAATVDEHFEANPVMELAEIMLSFGRVKGAAQALQEYIDTNPQEALRPWIRLMDIYRMAGMRHEFEKVARELNKNFNVEVQKWDADTAAPAQGGVDVVLDTESTRHVDTVRVEGIESMPAIMEQVLIRWESGDVIVYLNQLLRDNRGGTRLGFALPVVGDILFLIELKEVSNNMESDTKPS
jgi:pilus assembly protein FimV